MPAVNNQYTQVECLVTCRPGVEDEGAVAGCKAEVARFPLLGFYPPSQGEKGDWAGMDRTEYPLGLSKLLS